MEPIWNIPVVLYKLGVRHAVVCPGSRCAPLTIAFSRHGKITCKTITDERSAAFIGLGIAIATKTPVVLICTSGTAAVNFYPAICEAFYQQVPLLILTADRPAEWIDQGDGQAIRQEFVFANHVKKSFSFSASYDYKEVQWEFTRKLSEAYFTSISDKQGPIHLNIPFREPFYPTQFELPFQETLKIPTRVKGKFQLSADQIQALTADLKVFTKVLLIAGQGEYSSELVSKLKQIPCPLIAENLANIFTGNNVVKHHDLILSGQRKEEELEALVPELVISFGKPVLSKALKQFLRKHPEIVHWHISEFATNIDLYQLHVQEILISEDEFFAHLRPVSSEKYFNRWQVKEGEFRKEVIQFLQNASFSEFKAVFDALAKIPIDAVLHLSNSMPVRYANFFSLRNQKVLSNRGTSGIDGSISTAIGFSWCSEQINVVLTGDLSLFYDRNAFWNKYPKANLRVILLNNYGGGIFEMIEGPSKQPELEEFFVTTQNLEAENLCKDFDIQYVKVTNDAELLEALKLFYEASSTPKLLEIVTDRKINKSTFDQFKQLAKRA